MSVRQVTFSDLQKPGYLSALVDLGALVHKRSAYKDLKFDRSTLMNEIQTAVLSQDALILVAEKDDKVIGGLLAYIESPYYSKEKQSMDQIIFIHPDYSNTLDGSRLISKYVKWAKSKKAAHIYFCHSYGWADRESQDTDNKLGKYLMRRHGFKEMGMLYRIEKEVN